MARSSSLISSEEYLCGIYHNDDSYAFFRWKVSGLQGDAKPEYSYFRLPDTYKSLSVGAFTSIGSKIFMVSGCYVDVPGCSTDIFVVETEKLHTNDVNQILRKIPNALESSGNRGAVAVGRKIYIFPSNFGQPWTSHTPMSRFEVFDTVTETTQLYPEPYFHRVGPRERYMVLKSQILLCAESRLLFTFDMDNPRRGWRNVTRDFLEASARLDGDPLPLLPTLMKTECATELDGDDGGRFFGTCVLDPHNHCFAVLKFGSDPLGIENWYRVFGIPEKLLGRACFAHGGNVYFTYISDESPDEDIWEFNKFSLTYCCSPEEGFYVARQVFSFQVEHPSHLQWIDSFVIPPSI